MITDVQQQPVWSQTESRRIALNNGLRLTRTFWKGYGAGDGTRTRDVQLGKLAFYH